MITADTITDEQIRKLARRTSPPDVAVACKHALLGDYCARARCAEILNARSAK